jgi:hypothetical protein
MATVCFTKSDVTVWACAQQAIYLALPSVVRMDYREIVVRFSTWSRDLTGLRSLQTGPEVHPDSDSGCTGAFFPGGKEARVSD